MKLSALLAFNAIVAAVFGLTALLVPAQLYSTYGLTSDAGGQLVAQFFGAALLGYVVLTWGLRNVAPGEARRTLTLALFAQSVIGLVISLIAQLGGVVNALGWSTVALTAIFTLGYGYFRFMKPDAA